MSGAEPAQEPEPSPLHIELDHITNCDVCGIKGLTGHECQRHDCPDDATRFRVSYPTRGTMP